MRKQKIAILGGGVGAITTAFAITSQEDWQSRYEITVYQLGFRLGGKGASGRNPEHQQRIEEHGLHIWLGFYENAFRLMRACYAELGRPKTSPLATIEQAFKPHSFISLQEWVGDRFETWNFDFPTNGELPGQGGAIPAPRQYLAMILELVLEAITGTDLDVTLVRSEQGPMSRLFALLEALPEGLASAARRLPSSVFLRTLVRFVRGLELVSADALRAALAPAVALVDLWVELAWRPFEGQIERDTKLRRLVVMLDFARVVFKGIVEDELLVRGFSAVNDEEFSAWLKRHGALELTLRSALVRAWYDLVFGYPHGDFTKPGDCEAGTTLNAYLRLALTYKGAIFWEMQAGMGDTIFAPYYEVLRRRGVRFEFFRKVKNLGLDRARKHVETIDLDVQATLIRPDEPYDPLVEVKGLPCWPSVPKYELLVQGEELRARGVNLESSWANWEPVATERLTRGRDFDQVVLGISVAALTDVAPELIAVNGRFANMVGSLKTVQTLAMQLWLRPDREGLGWSDPKTVMTSYADPFNTWSDMSHLLRRECWPADHYPFNLAYFCGPMPDAEVIPPYTDHAFPQRELARVMADGRRWLAQWTRHLWPNVTREDAPRALDDAYLVDPADGVGDARLAAQYFRANIDKSERYVLSVTGSSATRLHPGDSGFANLYLAGDWTRCGLDAGCVEAATISGLLCAESLTGRAELIAGNYSELSRLATRSRTPARPRLIADNSNSAPEQEGEDDADDVVRLEPSMG
jgi:uncharacterized protein with NAD-binding domain and iron-sulfur cluster